ncbi:YdeI/OmpD-associated family protein [Fulvivirgaceae bacterium PWU20]|uniref:YdeI/OmpD-associated family protein n=1 Tax=Chryseosolibacter indicus TaxID=2782351 RepID=A0ABS5VRN8_9BACT|nr:YdeI/OmpD-associated family protein [Chryseosolibacter indicus]
MKVDETETFYPKNRKEWRSWLKKYHHKKESIWIIYYKKAANKPTLNWAEAVAEALCFGWIDSKAKPVDDEKYIQFFTRRKPTSMWSKINKDKVEQLIAEGLMTSAGLKCIEVAKENGSWEILDSVEALAVPEDLLHYFKKENKAKTYYEGLSKSLKKQLLLWLVVAKREETRKKRIAEIIKSLKKGTLPNRFRS